MLLPALLLPAVVSAFPFLNEIPGAFDGGYHKRSTAEAAEAAERRAAVFPEDTSNCGSQHCLVFNAKDQYVDVSDTGPNPYKAPTTGQIRGLCPGLNAAANHGFLYRSGLPTIANTITGLGAAYNMGADLAGFLAVVAVALDGDPVTQTWSIGGPFPVPITDGVLSTPGGIDNSHNKYEGDASVFRGDAYLNNGDPTVFKMAKFMNLYNRAQDYNFPIFRDYNKYSHDLSVSTNPYYFSAPFSGLVAPAAYQFVVNFMSNHSAANPEGTLTRDILKQFFSVSGPDNALVYTKGHERIPYNWYRRPTSDQHTIPKVFADLLYTASKYPDVIEIGGNTGKVNSFTGVNLGTLTGGTFTNSNILQGNNLQCFFFEAFLAVLPDELQGKVSNVASVLQLVEKYTTPATANLDCPQLSQYNQGLFNQFPGYTYNPNTTVQK